jgi:hypothetical protein
MNEPDKLDVIMAAITAILAGFLVVVVVLVILSAAGWLPDSWRF